MPVLPTSLTFIFPHGRAFPSALLYPVWFPALTRTLAHKGRPLLPTRDGGPGFLNIRAATES